MLMKAEISYILFADIKGYSRLDPMQLKRFHEQAMPALAKRLEESSWEYCNTWGDAVVICSKSARSIANCALEARDFFKTYDWAQHELPPLDIRISVHLGELCTGEDPFTRMGLIVGKSVVLAARIEPVTKAGQVWVTEQTMLAIREVEAADKARFGLDEIGLVAMPKGHGDMKVYLLRRAAEPAMSEAERREILAENEKRFPSEGETTAPAEGHFSVVIGVVIHKGKVALVRRKQNSEHLVWMFPSGTLLPLQEEEYYVWKEVKEETGLSCNVVRKIGERVHPKTKILCRYFYLEPTNPNSLQNADPRENDDAQWIDVSEVPKLIGDDLFDEVRSVLEATVS